MRFTSFERGGRKAIALAVHNGWRGLAEGETGFPGTLQALIEADGEALPSAAKTLAADVRARCLRVPDVGFDLGAYRGAALELPHRRLVFLNSFSIVLADG